MPFIPHTQADVDEMLSVIGVDSIEQLFDEISSAIPQADLACIPPGLNEMSIEQLMQERVAKNILLKNYIGAGAYEHYIPACVWDITSRGEFMTA